VNWRADHRANLPAPGPPDHIAAVRWTVLLVAGLAFGCGGAKAPPSQAPTTHQKAAAPARPANTLYRDEVQAALRRGLGHFLQLVDLEPRVETDASGVQHFLGFEVRALRPAKDWLSFDVAPGDLVTKVNGQSMERYETALSVFESLKDEQVVRVDLVRNGQPKSIEVRIVERAGNHGTKPAAAAPSSSAAPRSAPEDRPVSSAKVPVEPPAANPR